MMNKKSLILLMILLAVASALSAQSSSFRAQARYYTAVEEFEAGEYFSAIESTREAKRILGGTNVLLQYLHIMSAYEAGRPNEAFQEIERFFRLVEGEIEAENFPRGAEGLSDDEVDDILRIYDEVESAVASGVEDRDREQALIEEIDSSLRALVLTWNGVTGRDRGQQTLSTTSVQGRFPEYRLESVIWRGDEIYQGEQGTVNVIADVHEVYGNSTLSRVVLRRELFTTEGRSYDGRGQTKFLTASALDETALSSRQVSNVESAAARFSSALAAYRAEYATNGQ